MSNPSKRRGTAAEVAIADWLHDNVSHYVERRVTNGSKDRGDITGLPGVVIEIKDDKNISDAELLRQVDREMLNAGARTGAGIKRLRGVRDPGEWPVLMRLRLWAPEVLDISDRDWAPNDLRRVDL